MITGETLRLLRNWKNLKQKTVADKLGISQPAYSKLERSKSIKEKKLGNLLNAINCSKAELETFKKLSTNGENQV